MLNKAKQALSPKAPPPAMEISSPVGINEIAGVVTEHINPKTPVICVLLDSPVPYALQVLNIS